MALKREIYIMALCSVFLPVFGLTLAAAYGADESCYPPAPYYDGGTLKCSVPQAIKFSEPDVTVAPGASVTLSVEGGIGPYEWSAAEGLTESGPQGEASMSFTAGGGVRDRGFAEQALQLYRSG